MTNFDTTLARIYRETAFDGPDYFGDIESLIQAAMILYKEMYPDGVAHDDMEAVDAVMSKLVTSFEDLNMPRPPMFVLLDVRQSLKDRLSRKN